MCPGGMLAAEVITLPPSCSGRYRVLRRQRGLARGRAVHGEAGELLAALGGGSARRGCSLQGALLMARLHGDRSGSLGGGRASGALWGERPVERRIDIRRYATNRKVEGFDADSSSQSRRSELVAVPRSSLRRCAGVRRGEISQDEFDRIADAAVDRVCSPTRRRPGSTSSATASSVGTTSIRSSSTSSTG